MKLYCAIHTVVITEIWTMLTTQFHTSMELKQCFANYTFIWETIFWFSSSDSPSNYLSFDINNTFYANVIYDSMVLDSHNLPFNHQLESYVKKFVHQNKLVDYVKRFRWIYSLNLRKNCTCSNTDHSMLQFG